MSYWLITYTYRAVHKNNQRTDLSPPSTVTVVSDVHPVMFWADLCYKHDQFDKAPYTDAFKRGDEPMALLWAQEFPILTENRLNTVLSHLDHEE